MSWIKCFTCGQYSGMIGTAFIRCSCLSPIPSNTNTVPVPENHIWLPRMPRDPRGTVHPLDPAYDPPLYWPDPGWVNYRVAWSTSEPPERKSSEEWEKMRRTVNGKDIE